MIIRKKNFDNKLSKGEQLNIQQENTPQYDAASDYSAENSYNAENGNYSQEDDNMQSIQGQEYSENNYSPNDAPADSQHVQQMPEQQIVQPAGNVTAVSDNEINLFDLDNIDFSQRQERRRGDRRRGFRRVDDRNLVSRAREEADAIRESAMKEGYQAGLEQAQADIDEFKNSLGQFMNAKQEVFEYIAPDILEISVDIAKKIIKKEIEQDPQVLFNTIVDVLKTLSKEETKVTLRVNPAEVNETKQAVPDMLNMAGIDTKVVVLADENVSQGGCQVTTTNGIVDATIETRIEVVSKALREL